MKALTINKRIFFAVLAAAMAISMVSCGSDDESEEEVDSSFTYEQMETANTNAKTAYNAIVMYIANEEVSGKTESTVIEAIPTTIDATQDGEDGTIEHEIYEAIGDVGGEIYFIYPATVGGETESWGIQWRDTSESGAIGQYPDEISSMDDSVSWGTYYSAE